MTNQPQDQTDEMPRFPIVALCASAGGLEAFQAFFEALPAGSGMAFIVAQHQHPQQESILASILQRHSSIKVEPIANDMLIRQDHIYTLPSGFEVTVWNQHFKLTKFQGSDGWPGTLDYLLKSLAQDKGDYVAAIILSGAGTDGLEGARSIRENGGLVIAQKPETALQSTMPDSVIKAGLTHAILAPAEMPAYLIDSFKIDLAPETDSDLLADIVSEEDVAQVTKYLKRMVGRDFENYKTSTMQRQTARRMANLHIKSVDAYINHLQEQPEEAEQLVQHLLINVTSFFRDPQAFESLKTNALLPLLKKINIDTVFRVWVPGCASGEEAVSIAILLFECLRELDMLEVEVRIFATDANRELIRKGRSAFYPATIADQLSEARLRDHFIAEENGYRVRNHISRMIIWSEHNLVEHPPFSHLHLISCRNVLIYFQRRLQDRIISLFQFSLQQDGILFLGSSETLPVTSNEFTHIDSQHKIYRQTSGTSRKWLNLDEPLFKRLPNYLEEPLPSDKSPQKKDNQRALELVKEMLVEHFNTTCMIVDEHYHMLYSLGEIDRYLRMIPGANISHSVIELARQGLDIDLTIALHEAFNTNETVLREGVWIKTNGHERIVNLTIKPLPEGQLGNQLKLVIFEVTLEGQDLQSVNVDTQNGDNETDTTITRLQKKLQHTQEVLQSTTQALQAKSEELTSSMEEIRSANEEVQTSNEELRTSKEELESMNEELNTLNTQLTDQNHELTRAKNTLHNFLQSTEIGMIFLDMELGIREYTSAVTNIFGLRRSDVGRPLSEIAAQVSENDLIADANSVLDSLVAIEKEIRTIDGQWYNLRIRPYRTTNNVIDGLVLTFFGITAQKQAQIQAEHQSTYRRHIVNTIEDSLLELDSDLTVIGANQIFYKTFQVSSENTVGQKLYDLGNGQWNIADLRRLLTDIIPEEKIVRHYKVTHDFPELGKRTMRLNARQIAELDRILLVIVDMTSEEAS